MFSLAAWDTARATAEPSSAERTSRETGRESSVISSPNKRLIGAIISHLAGLGKRPWPPPLNTRRPRPFPAWAGEPLRFVPPYVVVQVYPRVGGGTAPFLLLWIKYAGLSPRGRGNP